MKSRTKERIGEVMIGLLLSGLGLSSVYLFGLTIHTVSPLVSFMYFGLGLFFIIGGIILLLGGKK